MDLTKPSSLAFQFQNNNNNNFINIFDESQERLCIKLQQFLHNHSIYLYENEYTAIMLD
jgi:hypothetical protein